MKLARKDEILRYEDLLRAAESEVTEESIGGLEDRSKVTAKGNAGIEGGKERRVEMELRTSMLHCISEAMRGKKMTAEKNLK